MPKQGMIAYVPPAANPDQPVLLSSLESEQAFVRQHGHRALFLVLRSGSDPNIYPVNTPRLKWPRFLLKCRRLLHLRLRAQETPLQSKLVSSGVCN